MSENPFRLVGYKPAKSEAGGPAKPKRSRPSIAAAAVLGAILFGCLFAELFMNHDPQYLDLAHLSVPPCPSFFFGTDPLGRDVFSMIWYGGRISLLIGFVAAAVSTAIAVVYGSVSACLPRAADDAMMRLSEIVMSIPSILTIIFLQAVIGQSDPFSLALVIGATSWMNMAKIVRTEVKRMKDSVYIEAARTMGAGFWYLLTKHLLPGLIPSLMFMVVSNIGAAISAEATLSFLGIGLPVETVSWGSLLSQADRALMTGNWWLIVIPGLFLIATLVCITDLGNYIRKETNRKCSNL